MPVPLIAIAVAAGVGGIGLLIASKLGVSFGTPKGMVPVDPNDPAIVADEAATKARELAAKLGVDLNQWRGSAPPTIADVQALALAAKKANGDGGV